MKPNSRLSALMLAACASLSLLAPMVATTSASAAGPVMVKSKVTAPPLLPGEIPLGMTPILNTDPAKQNQTYRNIAIDAAHKAMAGEKQYPANTNTLANIALTHYAVYGWHAPSGTWTGDQYLKKVLALQHTDGGWDHDPKAPLGNKVLQTIVTTDHVGPLLLMAYEEGKVDKAVVQKAVNYIMGRPIKTHANGGVCILQNIDHPQSDVRTHCVSNMNISAAWFLFRAKELGVTAPGVDDRIAKTDRFDRTMRRADKRWTYSDRASWGGKVMDLDHNALSAVGHREMHQIDYGYESIKAGWPTDLAVGHDPQSPPRETITPKIDIYSGNYVQNLNARLRLTPYMPITKCKATEADAKLYLSILDQYDKSIDKTILATKVWMVRYSQLARYSSTLANRCQP